jgi:ABC-type sugar transport system substrate-binding protein
MLHILGKMPSKIVVMHNDLTDAQRAEIGNERERVRNWIGTITADARRASLRLMKYLNAHLDDRPARVIGITGDPATPVSGERASGVQDWLNITPAAKLNQLVYSDWSASDSSEKTRVLLRRYPGTNLIWAANDSMTIGAQKASEAMGRRVVVGGVGALPEAVDSITKGGLTAMLAGDYFIGAIALVLIYDYHHGIDFAAHAGARRKFDYLMLVNNDNARLFRELLFDGIGDPDFSQFSKFISRERADYCFNVPAMLGGIRRLSQ